MALRVKAMGSELVILLAEDDAGHGALVRRGFARLGVRNRIEHFPDGQQVLDFFFEPGTRARRDAGHSYLLLLDIRMPKVDGMEVLRRIKEDPTYGALPVIMITTTEEPEDMEKCMGYGCSAYLVKPVSSSELASAVAMAGVELDTGGRILG